MNVKKKFRREICRLLIEEPYDWAITGFRATHKSRSITIWIANGCSGLDWSYGPVSEMGMSVFWFLWPWEWWRYRMLKLVNRAYGMQLLKHLG